MDATYDPNIPEFINGEYFCKLCLASMNSEQMWTSHIVGKRHIKNKEKYPNGLPKRYDDDDVADDDESYDRQAINDGYEDDNENFSDYPSTNFDDYYENDYYNRNITDYVPEVRPNVVIDYGHSKKLDEILLQDSKKPEVVPKIEKIANIDEILNDLKRAQALKSGQDVKPEKEDDFFQKLNQREIARNLALEVSKSKIFKNSTPSQSTSNPRITEESRAEQNKNFEDEKNRKRKAIDIMDVVHNFNDKRLFKGSKIKDSKDSVSSQKSSIKLSATLNAIDPDQLTPDVLDDLLSSCLEPKSDSTNHDKESPPNYANIDDEKVIAEKLFTLSNKTFLKLFYDKMKNLDLKDFEELDMLTKIISEAQEVVCRKLPAHVQALVKSKASEKLKTGLNVEHTAVTHASVQLPNTEVTKTCAVPSTSPQIRSTAVNQSCNALSVPSHLQNIGGVNAVSSTTFAPSRFPSPVPVSVGSSPIGNVSDASTKFHSTQSVPGKYPVLSVPPPNITSSNSSENVQMNSALNYYRMLAYFQSKEAVLPPTNSNSFLVPKTSSSSLSASKQILNCPPPSVSSLNATGIASFPQPNLSVSAAPRISLPNPLSGLLRISQPNPSSGVPRISQPNSSSGVPRISQPNPLSGLLRISQPNPLSGVPRTLPNPTPQMPKIPQAKPSVPGVFKVSQPNPSASVVTKISQSNSSVSGIPRSSESNSEVLGKVQDALLKLKQFEEEFKKKK